MSSKQKTMIVLTVMPSGIRHSITRRSVATLKQSGYRAMQISLFALIVLTGALAISVSAQQPDTKRVFAPREIKRIDNAKLRAAANPQRLSPAAQMRLLKAMPDVNPGNKSKTVWKPFFRLTPRNPFAQPGYWYFNQPILYTPHWYDDEGVAFFETAAPTSSQMVLLFSGQPNQAYAIDVTLWTNGATKFQFGYAVDGTPAPLKVRPLNDGKSGFVHLVFDLPASTSGEYEIGISCTLTTAWFGFFSLEAGSLQ